MKPSARYATAACRTRHYRERQAEKAQDTAVTSQPRRERRDKTGVRVGYQRVLVELHKLPVTNGLVITSPAAIERAVWEALPDRQRRRLQQRQETA
jgi:hypothetical protein